LSDSTNVFLLLAFSDGRGRLSRTKDTSETKRWDSVCRLWSYGSQIIQNV